MKRRAMLGGLGALAGAAVLGPAHAAIDSVPPVSPGAATANTADSTYKIIVGGLPGGQTDRWARAVALGMQHTLSPNAPVSVRTIGGRDGVTGANRLQTMVASDGQTAAMLPGEAVVAFLTGDARVHFQPGEWIPILAGLTPGVIVLRGGLARLSKPEPIRLAAAAPESADLAAILAFDKLGVPTVPIFGLRGAVAAARAFALGQADAVMLTGEEIPADVASLEAEGGVAICSFGVLDEDGHSKRDPQFTKLPTVTELATKRGAAALPAPLELAYKAVVAASRIEFMLVLPHLTPPAAVALWRQAALTTIHEPALQSATAASAISLTEAGAASAMAPLTASSDALLALRQMLYKRFGWRPS